MKKINFFTISLWPIFIISLFHSFDLHGQDWQLIWEDDFDGETIDTSKWSFQIGNGCPNLCGWGNKELEYYTDRTENAFLQDGNLIICAKEEFYDGYLYTSSRLRTIHKGDWKYGRIESRIQLPKGQGIWPAFWMLPTDNVYGTWPRSGEIDIMELIGNKPDTIHGTVHYGPYWPNNKQLSTKCGLGGRDFSENFHVFAIEWEPGEIRHYLDSTHYSTIKKEDLGSDPWPFDQKFHILINVAVGGTWPGNPDPDTEFPQTMKVDFIRVFQDSLLNNN